jgi:hypothetical protein
MLGNLFVGPMTVAEQFHFDSSTTAFTPFTRLAAVSAVRFCQ